MENAKKADKKRTKSNFGGKGWLLIIMCLFGGFMSSAGTGSVNISATYFNTLYGWSQTMMMLPLTIGSIIGVVIVIFAGKIMINRSPRRMIMILAIIFAACFLLNGMSRNLAWFWLSIIGCSICGFMWSMICCPNLIANWFPRKTGLAMGWVTMGLPLGSGIAVLIMRPIFSRFGMFPSYIPYACLAIILGIITLTCLKDFPAECGCYPDNDKDFDMEQVKKEEEAVKAMRAKSPWTVKRILTTKEFWFIWVSVALMAFCTGFISQVVTTLMSYGVSMTVASYCMIIVCLVACVGSFVLGKIDARFGPKVAMLVGCCMVFAMAIIAQFNFLACKVIAFMFVGAIMGGASNFMLSMIMKCWGQLNCMSVYRFAQPLCSLVQGFAVTLIAAIAGAFGGNYNMSFLVMGFLGVIALILVILIRPGNIPKKEQKFTAQTQADSDPGNQPAN